MKKTYKKPVVIIEDFSLQTSIAGNCELVTPMASYEENCGNQCQPPHIVEYGLLGP